MNERLHFKNRDNQFYGILIILFVLFTVLAFLFDLNNTGGDNDNHFLMSAWSWKYPYLLFDHWGKPAFTILASPFAQLGFNYVKVFNVIVTLLACLFAYRTAKTYGAKNLLWIPLIYFCAHDAVMLTLTSLTEPLFAFLLMIGIYLYFRQKFVWGTVILSFLPLSRSEGLIILCVIFVYLIFTRKYKYLLLLPAGQIIISILGYFVYEDIFWVFTKIPYATLKVVYWKGSILHFVKQTPFMIGLPSFILLCFGWIVFVAKFAINFYKKKTTESDVQRLFLIYGCYTAFLLAHSIFYYLGIFGEMGLTRVFIAVMPLIVLICLDAVDVIDELLSKRTKQVYQQSAKWVIALLLVFFCYGTTPYSIKYKKEFHIHPGAALVKEQVVPYVKHHYPGYKAYFSDISIAFYGGYDIFKVPYGNNIDKRRSLQPDEVIIWDEWFSRIQEGIQKDSLLSSPYLLMDTSFTMVYERDTIEYAIFRARSN